MTKKQQEEFDKLDDERFTLCVKLLHEKITKKERRRLNKIRKRMDKLMDKLMRIKPYTQSQQHKKIREAIAILRRACKKSAEHNKKKDKKREEISYSGCPPVCFDGPCVCNSRIDE